MKGCTEGAGTLSPSLGPQRPSSVGCARSVPENRSLQRYHLAQLSVCPLSLLFSGYLSTILSFPGGTSGKEPAYHFRRRKTHGSDPWVRKIPWRRAWQPIPKILACRVPQTDEPVGLQSMGSQRVGHD